MARVLIIEDDDDGRLTMSQVLHDAGHEVLLAENGVVGLDLLHGLRDAPRPDIVLLDLMMPDLNGWGFLAAVRSDPVVNRVPIVVITAMGAIDARKKELTGAAFILHKPINLDLLLTTVDRSVHPRSSAPPFPDTT
jgi:two-component system nitrogen regulation response regulator NtrX